MTDPHRQRMEAALKEAADGLIAASDGMIAANRAIKRFAEAALLASDERGGDLRESVNRLEALVMELIRRERGDAGQPG